MKANKMNYRKQTILFGIIFLAIFSCQSLSAQEEAEELKTENKSEITQKEQKEEQITTENQSNGEVIPTTSKQENKNVSNKKYSSKKQNKKRAKQNNSENQIIS